MKSEFQTYRAPRAHCDKLVEPPFDDAPALLRRNVAIAESFPASIRSLRAPARKQLLRDARRYTSAYRDVAFAGGADPTIVMAGHQPTLFHPGVWFKNFALDRVAALTDSVAVNLVVDSDVAGASSIRVPQLDSRPASRTAGSLASSSLASSSLASSSLALGSLGYAAVAYDQRGGGVPYEQALIEDRDVFDAFDQNVRRAVAGIVDDPMIDALWQYARDAIQRCGFAGCTLAQARHRLEADLGLNTLEIPQSVVCRGESFAAFVMQILLELPRFHECYNTSADFYRQAHGIRSSAHPVPNLGRDGEWYEAPLWVYGNQSPKRRGVWVRMSGAGKVMEISDRENRHRKFEVPDASAAADVFLALASPEFKIRSRALVTTMYARMVLSDLFLHGIGGGKYDQLGDLISRAFWQIESPSLMVMSATVLLPGHQSHSLDEVDAAIRRLVRQRRDLDYQPERFADRVDLPPDLVAAKRDLLDSIPERGQRQDWHQQITAVNHQLSQRLQPLRSELDAERARLNELRREAVIWNNREHPFCIYPLGYLTDAYDRMLGVR